MKILYFKFLLICSLTGFIIINSCDGQSISDKQDNKTTIRSGKKSNKEKPVVYIYNFHLKRRCVNCLAMEKVVNQTLEKYFQNEVKAGQIKMEVINVEDDVNKKLVEKFEVYGMALYIVRSYKGKEKIIDMTGDGVKYAKNKPDKLIEILKSKISDNLK
ncbi:MAG: nitrophenyl compound nitroreductase subunit ArsF family protein [Deltaproteobacteria bacterium]